MSPHRFPAEGRRRLTDEHRRKVQPAEDIISRMEPSRDEICVDLGCGPGYITVPIASRAREVVGFDSQREMLDALISNAKGIENVYAVMGEMPFLPFRSASIDRALLINVAHEVEDKDLLAEELDRILSSNGRLSIVDFPKKPTSFGPPVEERLTEEEMISIFPSFRIVKKWSLEEYYQLELKKS